MTFLLHLHEHNLHCLVLFWWYDSVCC